MITARAARRIESAYRTYHRPEYLSLDPLLCVHRFTDAAAIETAGLAAAALAYGRVETIVRNVDRVLARAGSDPVRFALGTTFREKCRAFDGFKHRFTDGFDMALLFESLARAIRDRGSLGTLFRDGCAPADVDALPALGRFARALRGYARAVAPGRDLGRFEFLVTSPENGSACKRMNMYLRWMVRPRDGIDLGVWQGVSPAMLVVPVDTHVARIARSLGLTRRKTADLRMAREITGGLRALDPGDPVKFDFSLCRMGMIGLRTSRRDTPSGHDRPVT